MSGMRISLPISKRRLDQSAISSESNGQTPCAISRYEEVRDRSPRQAPDKLLAVLAARGLAGGATTSGSLRTSFQYCSLGSNRLVMISIENARACPINSPG